jgi:hypothetical protein
MTHRTSFAVGLIVAAASLGACTMSQQESLTLGQAQQALEKSGTSNEAIMAVSGTIELATNFTMGQAVEAAAEEVGSFIAAELPCAEITLIDATLTIEYGAKPGNCSYRGHEYSGTHVVTVERADSGDVEVLHQWTDLSNGVLLVSGTAAVTWSIDQDSRRVVHELEWTRLETNETGVGSGDVVQTNLEGGLLAGIQLDGTHAWDDESGAWDLAITGLELRWVDPVPQAGTLYLTTPFDADLTMTFVRVDASKIAVTIKSGELELTINVTSLG